MFISYAQNFEDVMLWRALGQVTNGFYIDIGAQEPVVDSVSLAFYERGWRGVHVEPSPMFAEKLRQARPGETVIQALIDSTGSLIKFYEFPETGLSTGEAEIAEKHQAAGFSFREIEVPSLTLASLLDRYADREIHWLKIDVEGMEKRAIESWEPSRVRPWILVVESTLPLESTPSHRAWDPLVLSLGYKFVYFDGLNRFYVSKAHRELKKAFLAGPNIFDDFALNGTASAPFCYLLHERLRSQAKEMSEGFEKQIESAQQQIDHLTQTIGTREQALAEREKALDTQLQSAQDEYHRLEQEGAARERDLTKVVLQSKQDLEWLLRHVAAKEKEFGEQLLRGREDAEKDRAEQARIHAEREQALIEQLLSGQQELLNLEREWAQAEKALNQEIAGLQSEIQALNHSQQLQAQQHGFELTTKQDELNRLMQTGADLEAQLKAQMLSEQQTSLQLRQTIAEVEQNLAVTHASLSWRMTAPLRKMASFITPRKGPKHSLPSPGQAEPSRVIEPAVAKSLPTEVQPTSQRSMELIMPPAPPSFNLNVPVASSLDELLAHSDQAFISCAYQTLLGRDPDEEGLNYYLVRLRTGIPKIQILDQLRRSEEGKDYAADLPRLNAAIRRYRWAHKAIIGWLVRLFVRVEGNSSTERKLRGLECQLYQLGEENNRRFDQMGKALTGLHQLLAEGRTAQAEPDIPAPPSPAQPFDSEAMKQLSPRARDIYFQLKTAAAIHAGGPV